MDLLQFRGTVEIYSQLSIEEVGRIISEKLFGSLPFGGKDEFIYEEVPAIFIASPILGMRAIIQEGEDFAYFFEIKPWRSSNEYNNQRIDIADYLVNILEFSLEGRDDIKVVGVPK